MVSKNLKSRFGKDYSATSTGKQTYSFVLFGFHFAITATCRQWQAKTRRILYISILGIYCKDHFKLGFAVCWSKITAVDYSFNTLHAYPHKAFARAKRKMSNKFMCTPKPILNFLVTSSKIAIFFMLHSIFILDIITDHIE